MGASGASGASAWEETGETQMKSMQQDDRQQAQRLKRNIKRLIHDQLYSINPWWFISFHYRDHHSKEDELLEDVADLKRKLHRIIYKSRDKSLKGAGEYIYNCFPDPIKTPLFNYR